MRFGKKACNWRSLVGVLAVGALACGLNLEGAPVSSVTKVSPVMTGDAPGTSGAATATDQKMVKIGRIPSRLPVNPVQVVDYRNDIGTRLREAGLLVGPMPAAPVDPDLLNGIALNGIAPAGGIAGVPGCSFDVECEDGVPCTDDICNIGPGASAGTGVCMHEVVVNGDNGDLNGDDCDDGIECNGDETCQGSTVNACEGVCVGGDPLTAGTACTRETNCIGGGTCSNKTCQTGPNSGAACIDNTACVSLAGGCSAGTPIACTGGQVCDENGSDPAACVAACATAGDCDDGLTCNGVEVCETSGLCTSPGNPCGHLSNTICLEKKCLQGGPGITNTRCETFLDCVATNVNSCGTNGPYCFFGRCCGQDAALNANKSFAQCTATDSWYPGDKGVIAPGATPRCPIYGAGIASIVGAQEYFATVGPTSLAPFPNPFTNTTLHKLGDDYDASGVGTGGFIKLEKFRFAGGVTDGGSSRISFEFYDANGNFVEDVFFISNTNSGSVQVVNVLALAPTLRIPDKGFVVAHVLQSFGTPTARSEMFWLSTDTTDQGTNNPNELYISNDLGQPAIVPNFLGVCAGGDNDGLGCSTVGGSATCPGGTCNSVPGVLAFEMEGDKVADGPSGACCDGTSAGCNELLVWECRSMAGSNYLGDGIACASCSNDSALPGNACRTCSDTGIACTGAVDCPTGTCDLNDLLCRQCDDFLTPCSQDADCAGIGGGLCGAGSCQLASGCGIGSCCIPATGECQDGHTAATCTTLGGTFNGLGSDCEPNCCVQPLPYLSGADNCQDAVATVVTVPSGTICQGGTNDGLACATTANCGGNPCERAVTVTVTGNNATASSTFTNPDSCIQPSDTPGSELGWYEAITIVDPAVRAEDTIGCAYLRVDHCCSVPVKIPAFRILYDACPCGDNIFTKSNPNFPLLKADARGAPFCALDNAWQQFGPLREGNYWYPIFSQLGGNFEQYQFHVRLDACPDAVCCTGSNCNVVNILECQAAGGTFLAPPNLSVGQTFCSGQCDVGSCCTGPGLCLDNQIPGVPPVSFVAMDQNFCENSAFGSYVGGIRCFGGTCAGGQQVGQSCSVAGDCPGSSCIGDTLALAQPSPCPVCENIGPNNCQRNDDSVVQRGSDLGLPGGGVHVADDFIPLTPTITTVCTWGVYTAPDPDSNGAIDCGTEALQDSFRVRVYGSDADGLPDTANVVGEVLVSPANVSREPIANSANELLGNSVLFAYQFDLTATPITGLVTDGSTTYWLEITNKLDGVCSWNWQTVDTQNNDYAAGGGAGEYGPSSARSRDMAFCLSTDFDPGIQPTSFCCACDGTCAEKTLRDCQTDISRWRVGETCTATVCEAGPPANDLCTPVATMVIPDVLAGTVRFDNTCSNADGINVGLNSDLGAVAQISGDVWYTYIATDAGTLTVSTCPVGQAAGGGIDTILAVYHDDTNPTVCSCNADDADMIARTAWYTEPSPPVNTADENCDGIANAAGGFVSGEAAAGDCFLIRVGGFPGQGSEEGAGTITITLESTGGPVPPPAEDSTGGGGHGQRYLEIAATGSTGLEVIRVKPLVTPDLTGGPSVMYLGVPFSAPDGDLGDPARTFTASLLGCEPVAADFGAFTSIAVYGAEIIPSTKTEVAQYSVQRADATCPNLTTDEACWSTELLVSQGLFGDVASPFFSAQAQIQPDLRDIGAYVSKFLAQAGSLSKPSAQLVKNIARPFVDVNLLDISNTVGGFLGSVTYATARDTTGFCTCPSSVTCGATACTGDAQCPGGLCDLHGAAAGGAGFCVDGCGRCAP